MQSFDVVVSSENNDYLAWQCMVFYHSCMLHMGQAPIIVVHGDNKPLVQGYRMMQAKGAIIQRLPTFRNAGTVEYACRNAWATLKGVKTSADNIVLCDPDMIFLRKAEFAEIAEGLRGEAVSLDRADYLKIGDHNRPMLEAVCKASWIDKRLLDGITSSGGVPYVIPTDLRRRIAREWEARTEDCLMTNLKIQQKMNSEVWLSVMWSFVLAAFRSDIAITVTDMSVINHRRAEEKPSLLSDHAIIHYCQGDSFFDKRAYFRGDAARKSVWKASAPDGTVNGAVVKAIHETAVFYGLG